MEDKAADLHLVVVSALKEQARLLRREFAKLLREMHYDWQLAMKIEDVDYARGAFAAICYVRQWAEENLGR